MADKGTAGTRKVVGKEELTKGVAKAANVSAEEAAKVLKSFYDTVGSHLHGGSSVQITGFGTFKMRKLAKRIITDLRTKQKREVPASTAPSFSPGEVLKRTSRGQVVASVKAVSKGASAAKGSSSKSAKAAVAKKATAPKKAAAKVVSKK